MHRSRSVESAVTIVGIGTTGYLKDDSRVSVDSARLSGEGNEILIDGMEHDGGLYRLRLRWNRGSQGFAPVEITPLE